MGSCWGKEVSDGMGNLLANGLERPLNDVGEVVGGR